MSFGGTWRRWRSLLACAGVVTLYLAVPSGAAAQVIAGIVRDASGAVLPGVTVEASSPALIEKVRSTVTDGTGQYRLENLSPGVNGVVHTSRLHDNRTRECSTPERRCRDD